MAGDPGASGGWLLQLVLDRMDKLGGEFHDELGELRREMQVSHEALRRDFVEQGRAHAAEHAQRRLEVDGKLRAFEDFMKARELRQAREDGALGVLRFVLDTGGRNWQLVATLLGFLGLALGNIHLDVGVR